MPPKTTTLRAADIAGRLRGLLAGFAVVSCDIFDTAVTRILARAEDVHLAAGARLAAQGLCDFSPEAFREYRSSAEHELRKGLRRTGREEIRLHEVYEFLAGCGIVKDAVQAAAQELEVEKAALRPVAAIRDVLGALREDQRLVFVSDTILPGDWLKDLLIGLGFGPRLEVFCSADIGFTKHSGKLFAQVLAKLDCDPLHIIHMGDNFRSDVVHAKENGLATLYLPRRGFLPEKDELASKHFLVRLAASARRVQVRETGERGAISLAHYFTCLLLGYTLFVLDQAKCRGIRRIYFLARDGYLPHLFAQAVNRSRGDDLELVYLHVSRRAIVLPLLADDFTQLSHEISQHTLDRPLLESLEFLGLSPSEARALVMQAGLDPDRIIANPSAPQLVQQLFSVHADLIKGRLRQMGDLAATYARAAGLMQPGPKIVADLGWKGSTQKALSRLAGIEAQDLIGCYLGLWGEALSPGELTPQNAQAYLFQFGYPKRNMEIVRDGYGVLELLFSAPHGTLLGYGLKAGEAVPVHASETQMVRREELLRIQEGCLEEFGVLESLLAGNWPNAMDPESALFDLEHLLTRPSSREVEHIAPIRFLSGINGGEMSGTVNPMGLRQLFLDSEAAIRRFENAPWRAGSLRASLPEFVPAMTFADFRHRVRRIRRLLRLSS